MEDNLPISNIPLIFTKYRTRVLEESGQQWFHSENNPNIVESAFAASSLDDLGDLPPDLIAQSTTPAEPSPVIPPTLNPSTQYDYPDPWESNSPKFENLNASVSIEPSSISMGHEAQTNNEDSGNPETVIRHLQTSQAHLAIEEEASTVGSETSLGKPVMFESVSSQSAQRVNLFPFEREDSPDLEITGIYDLTEFDNGELEVPPVAVRESQPAKFEKVHRPQAPAHTQSVQDDDVGEDPSFVDPETLSSAELAKYRLRNCL